MRELLSRFWQDDRGSAVSENMVWIFGVVLASAAVATGVYVALRGTGNRAEEGINGIQVTSPNATDPTQ